MIYEDDASRIVFFAITLVVMTPFFFLAYKALRKSKQLPYPLIWRVRIGASALLLLCGGFLLMGLFNLILAILN